MTTALPPRRRLSPTGAHAAAALVFLALGGILFWPTLRPGTWAFGTDTIAHDLVCEAYGWSVHWTEGGVPWWGHHLRAGQPMLGSFAFMPFYPLNWLTGLAVRARGAPWPEGGAFTGIETERLAAIFVGDGLTLPRAHTMQWVLHLVLAAWFMYRAVRVRGAGWTAGVLGGIVFGFSSHVATLTYAGHLAKVQAIAWLPAVVWAVEAAELRRTGTFARRVVPWFGAAAALSMQWLAGHPQIWAYTCGVALALTAARGWWDAAEELQARARLRDGLRSLVECTCPIILSLLLAAPMTFAAVEFAPHSNRASLTYEEATKSSHPPEELWEIVVPRAAGDSVMPALGGTGTYRGRWGERIVSDYLGVPVVALAIAGLFLGTGWRRWFWAAVAIGATLLSLGTYLGPVYRAVVVVVPLLGSFRSPATIMVLIPLAAAFLASEGWQAIAHGDGRRTKRRVAMAVAVILLIQFAAVSGIPKWTLESVAGAYSEAQRLTATASWHHAIGAMLGTLAIIAVMLRRPNRRLPGMLGIAPLVIVAADLIVAGQFFVRPAPVAAFDGGLGLHQLAAGLRRELTVEPHAASSSPPPGLLLVGREMNLWPMLAGWRVPHSYHPITFERLEERMRALGHDSAEFLDIANVRAVVGADGSVTLRPPLVASAPPESREWMARLEPGSRLRVLLADGMTSACLPLPYDSGWKCVFAGPTPAARQVDATLAPAYWGMGTTVQLAEPAKGVGVGVDLAFWPLSRRAGPAAAIGGWLALAALTVGGLISDRRRRHQSAADPTSAALDSPAGAP